MKYLDEFRDPELARRLLAAIKRRVTRPWTIMEVCGGQTHSLLRHGLVEELAGSVELVHGPGCPVCVTPAEDIDLACRLALRLRTTLASFGDMLRVPGTRGSLLDARAAGGSVRLVYSPLEAVSLAERHPQTQVIFFAVGFETTAPTTALAALQAQQRRLPNFSLLVSHVRVQPAMEQIVQAPGNRIQGFLAAGHVCTVAGYASYHEFVEQHRLPVVVTGFEPVDLLWGILECVRQLEAGQARVANCYGRMARREGNKQAIGLVERVYQICDRPWRGLGVIPGGGLCLRPEFVALDARLRFGTDSTQAAAVGFAPRVSEGSSGSQVQEPLPVGLSFAERAATSECRAGEVLAGRLRPDACPAFGTRCTPERPLGAPMVSAEGACAAYYRYRLVGTGAAGE